MRNTIFVFLGTCLFVGGLFMVWARMAKPAVKLGANRGQLAACPASPNCVSSQATDEAHQVAPLVYHGDDPVAAMQQLQTVIKSLPRAKIVTEADGYLHAEFRSALIGYVDDVECVVDPTNHVIHIRSASRVGYSDFGANRRRVEAIRAAFNDKLR
jgi:uncharacterized protein (DUF1499 family)